MRAKTHVHELIKSALTLGIARALPDGLWFGVETTIYLSANQSADSGMTFSNAVIMTENVALPLRLSGSTRHVAGEHARQMLDRFGSPELALAAYNAGPGNVTGAPGHVLRWCQRSPSMWSRPVST